MNACFERLVPLVRNNTGQTAQQCNFEQYGLVFPLTKVTEEDLLNGMDGAKVKRDSDDVESSVRLWGAHWKNLIDKRTNKTFSGTQLQDALLDILEILHHEKEVARVKRNQQELEKEREAIRNGSLEETKRKRRSAGFVVEAPYSDKLNGTIEYFPYAFLTFMVLGPPAGQDYCHHSFCRSDNTNMDGSSSDLPPKNKRQKKEGSNQRGNSRRDAREELHEERSQSDREKMKMDLILMQQAEASAILVTAETDLRKAQMDEIVFLEKRFGEDSDIVKQHLEAFATSKRVNEIFDLTAHVKAASSNSRKSRLHATESPSPSVLVTSYTPSNSSISSNTSSKKNEREAEDISSTSEESDEEE